MGVKDGVIRSSLHSQKRTHDILTATEERIAALKAELAESEHHVVGLSTGEIIFRSCSNHARCSQRPDLRNLVTRSAVHMYALCTVLTYGLS